MTRPFSRKQLSAATGVPGDLLAYWIKLGLLRPMGGGDGKGKHRQFGFQAVHIAAVLAELGRYGMNGASLRRAAATLWGIIDFARRRPDITERDTLDCADLKLARQAGDFEDWLALRQQGKAAIGARAFEMESWFDDTAKLGFELYFDMFSERSFTDRTTRWIVAIEADALMILPEGMLIELPQLMGLPSYISLNVSNIVQLAWARLEELSPDRPGAATHDRSLQPQTEEEDHDSRYECIDPRRIAARGGK